MRDISGPEFETDMQPLVKELAKTELSFDIHPHPVVVAEPGVKELIGYNPTGDWQIVITTKKAAYSVIRGMGTFGAYEIMLVSGKGKFERPERFSNAKKLVSELLP